MPGSINNATSTAAAATPVASPRATRSVTCGTSATFRHVEATGEHQVIMAERFKTKQCRTFQQTGACPYEFKCMFAHGSEELRSQQDNERDGLTSEEAVKTWQRARRLAKSASPAPVDVMSPCAPTSKAALPVELTASPTLPKPRSRQFGGSGSMTYRSCPHKFPVGTDVVVKETEYKNLTPVCAAWVSALLTPASPSSGHWPHDDLHAPYNYHGIAPGAADDYFQTNGGLIG